MNSLFGNNKILTIFIILLVFAGVWFVNSEVMDKREGKVETGENLLASKKAIIAPELVDEKAELKEKDKFLEKLNTVLPPKVILEKLGHGTHEFTLELNITGEGNLGSFRIAGEDTRYSEQLRDIIYSGKFEKFLTELNYKPAKMQGQTVGSTIPLKLLVSLDEKGNISAPWYVFPSSNSRKEGFKPLNIMEKTEYKSSLTEMPEYPGGTGKLMNDIIQKIVYPENAKKAGVEGKVLIALFVDEKGEVASAEILKEPGAGLGQAALSVVKDLRFIPGKENGQPAKARLVLPFVFKLQ